jgi:hypothetical protein
MINTSIRATSKWLLPDPALRDQLARAAEQAEQGRYVTASVGVALLIVATVGLGRAMDGVVAGVWGLSQPGMGGRLRRAARYSGALVGVAATHVAALAVLDTVPVPLGVRSSWPSGWRR